ncbi:MAG: chromate transporter [Saccharofermentanales bacterium]|jgi:chromate transporter
MSLGRFFFLIFRISSLTFGGGYTIVPMIREEFVQRQQVLSDDEMLDLIALSQASPGALAVSTSLLTGYKLKGKLGAVLGALGAALPPLIIISVLYYFYEAFAQNVWVRAALRGMSGAVAAIMILAVWDLGKASLKKHPVFSSLVLVGAFLVSFFTTINTGLIILAIGLLGIVTFTFVPEEHIR